MARGAGRHVVHVLPADAHRGAQRYARLMADALDRPSDEHVVVTLFDSSEGGLAKPDRCVHLCSGTAKNPVLLARDLRLLRRTLAELQPSVVVSHGSEPLHRLVVTMPSGVPLVLLRIGTNAAIGRLAKVVHRWEQQRPVAVIGVSRDALEASFELGRRRGPLDHVIPNGRSPESFHPAQRPVVQGVARLLFVGSLDAWKQPGLFLDVVEQLRDGGAEVSGSIVGTGPLQSELRRRIDASGLPVELLGQRHDVPLLMRNHDALVFTSGAIEGLPGVLVEAGLSGLPVVTTPAPGASDVVADGETGFVVEGRAEALAAALELLVDDTELRRRMGAAARRRCVERFDLESTLERWARLFDELAPLADECRPRRRLADGRTTATGPRDHGGHEPGAAVGRAATGVSG